MRGVAKAETRASDSEGQIGAEVESKAETSTMIRAWAMVSALAATLGPNAYSQPMQPDIYDCRIHQYFQQDDAGMLFDILVAPKTAYAHETKGASFLVDRRSGTILTRASALGFLPNFLPDVAERGSTMQAFKVRYRSPPGVYIHLAYLEVKTYAHTLEKPFVLIDGGSVFAGLCK